MYEVIPLKHCPNVRDLGGMETKDGNTLKRGRFIRSSTLVELTVEEQCLLVEDHKLGYIIDLRADSERKSKQDVVPEGVQYFDIPLREDIAAFMNRPKGQSILDYARKVPSMPQMYKNMVTKENSLEALRRIFAILIQAGKEDKAVLFHCSEGKDRTGIVAALIERYLGVSEEDIKQDYLLSNEAYLNRNKWTYVATRVVLFSKKRADNFRSMYEAQYFMLEDMFRTVDETYGSLELFLTDTLGLTTEDLASFRETSLT